MTKFILAFLSMFILMSTPALAVNVLGVCDKGAGAQYSTVCKDRDKQTITGTNPINNLIHVAADILAILTGVAAIILIIVSAFKFSASGGSAESVKSARSTLIAAAIGLAIVAMAWTIITFLTDRFIK